jgi:hypothetical protein
VVLIISTHLADVNQQTHQGLFRTGNADVE